MVMVGLYLFCSLGSLLAWLQVRLDAAVNPPLRCTAYLVHARPADLDGLQQEQTCEFIHIDAYTVVVCMLELDIRLE